MNFSGNYQGILSGVVAVVFAANPGVSHAELFQIELKNNVIDNGLLSPGLNHSEGDKAWFTDLTGDGSSDFSISRLRIGHGDAGLSNEDCNRMDDPVPNFEYLIDLVLVLEGNGSKRLWTSADRTVVVNDPPFETSPNGDGIGWLPLQFTPPGYTHAVMGLLGVEAARSENIPLDRVGLEPPSCQTEDFRKLTFTRLVWDDASDLSAPLDAGAMPLLYGTTEKVGAQVIFTPAPPQGLLQIDLVGNTFDFAVTPEGSHEEIDYPWFTDLTGNGEPDVTLTAANFFDDGAFASILIRINGRRFDTSIEFDLDPEGYIINEGFVDDSEESFAVMPITFTPPGFDSPVEGLLELTVAGNPQRRISLTRLIWDTRMVLTSLPNESARVVGSTREVGANSVYTPTGGNGAMLRIDAIRHETDRIVLEITGGESNYSVDYSTDLEQWRSVATDITGSSFSTENPPSARRGFWRLRR